MRHIGTWRGVTAVGIGLAGALSAQGAVIVTEVQGDGSAWVHNDPAVATNASSTPSFFTTGVSVPGNGSIGQTFVPTETFVLDKIDLAYSTSAASTIGVRIAKTTTTEAESSFVYTLGDELVNLSFSLTQTTSGVQVLTLDFTGDDQVTLTAGQQYVLEFYDSGNGANLSMRRRGSNTYGQGMLFSNRSSVNGTQTRDAAMQIFAVPEPTSLAAAAIGALVLIPRRRRACGC